MTLLTIYFIAALIILYTEAKDCYIANRKFDIAHELIFSILWVVALPLAVYTIWKESVRGYK